MGLKTPQHNLFDALSVVLRTHSTAARWLHGVRGRNGSLGVNAPFVTIR